MALVPAALSTYLWDGLVAEFPPIVDAWRRNEGSGIVAHRPMEIFSGAWSAAVLDEVVGLPCSSSTAVGDALGGWVSPADIAALYPGIEGAKELARDSVYAALGWSGVQGRTFSDLFVDLLGDYLAANTEFGDVETSPISGSGATVNLSISAPGVGPQISARMQANLLSSGFFYYGDDPTKGLAGELVRLVDSLSDAVPILLGAADTEVEVPSQGASGASVVILVGTVR